MLKYYLSDVGYEQHGHTMCSYPLGINMFAERFVG